MQASVPSRLTAPAHTSSPLARYLLGVYAVLIVYGSLYPWLGWRSHGVHPFAFFSEPWPRYRTWFDIVTNFIAYVPLGGLAVAALLPMRRWLAFAAAVAAGAALSFCMESLQTYLPTRVSSNLDFALNSTGALLGALLGVWLAPSALAAGGVRALRAHLFRRGRRADAGLILLALWLLTQLNPVTLLFGTGDLRELIGALPTKPYPPEVFVRLEAVVVATNLTATGLIMAHLISPARKRWPLVLGLLGAALLVRSVAFAVLFEPNEALSWFTPGAAAGLALGTVACLLVVRALPRYELGIAAVCISIATAVVNTGPENPYLAESLAAWRQGQFLNFNGLTRALSAVWPFLAMIYVVRRERRAS